MEIGISEFVRSLSEIVGIESFNKSFDKTTLENRLADKSAKNIKKKSRLILIWQISYKKQTYSSNIFIE
jgi:hypothetical protein